eukprot:symbB.v1.2.009653.t1/scaffold593.1/size185935/4
MVPLQKFCAVLWHVPPQDSGLSYDDQAVLGVDSCIHSLFSRFVVNPATTNSSLLESLPPKTLTTEISKPSEVLMAFDRGYVARQQIQAESCVGGDLYDFLDEKPPEPQPTLRQRAVSLPPGARSPRGSPLQRRSLDDRPPAAGGDSNTLEGPLIQPPLLDLYDRFTSTMDFNPQRTQRCKWGESQTQCWPKRAVNLQSLGSEHGHCSPRDV